MRGLLVALVVTVSIWGQAAGGHASAPEADPWFATFSMIAFDPATNELGVGVQSRAFAAGAAVPYAKPGVGAVATQASANRQYGPKAIALLEQGLIAGRRRQADHRRRSRPRHAAGGGDRHQRPIGGLHRQARHRSQLRSEGSRCTSAATPATSPARTSPRRATRWRATRSSRRWPKPTRTARARWPRSLMDALDAGQSKGGDTRGMQSAGILVVRPLAAELRVHRRTHRRHPGRRCAEPVRGVEAAARHRAAAAAIVPPALKAEAAETAEKPSRIL